ncbi:MAG: radical SAM protein [Chloroflexota bacterium]|nr:MAG: radical SAM protein [Chloroflexota bacterium]
MPNSIIAGIKSIFRRDSFPSPGLHHYLTQTPESKNRIHLRLDPDGHGTLMINANRVVHLNPTAAFMTYLHLEKTPADEAQRAIIKRYHVTPEQAQADFERVTNNLDVLLFPDKCPICSLPQLEIEAPFSMHPTAPYRMDLAITYRCNNNCLHCYNIQGRNCPEITTEKWKKVIDKLWDLSIPHIVFTGGEPTLRDDLPELIAYAEAKGQITGLNTNARRLSDSKYVQNLIAAGLDHVQITVESHSPQIHDEMVNRQGAWEQTIAGVKNVLASPPLYVMTNTTMLQNNYETLPETLDFLAEIGVPTIGLNALIYSGRGKDVGSGLTEKELKPLLTIAKEKTQAADQRLIWYTPTQYCHFDPMELNLGVKGCSAALYNMCVEPDGGVIPCQSYYHQLGNILTDKWNTIWEHELAVSIRERKYVPEVCKTCPVLAECGGGCPLALENHEFTPTHDHLPTSM